MTTLELQLENQLLTILNQEIIASGDTNTDQCAFSFSDEWEGYVKTAVFYQDKANTQYVVLESDDTCMIPATAMAREGNLHIGVFGISGSKVLTSTVETIYINEGAISGEGISTEPSDDVFLAIVAQYQGIAELMHTYDEKATELLNQTANLNKETQQAIAEQNEILQSLNAFDVTELGYRMSAMEMTLSGYGNIIKEEHEKLDNKLQIIEDSAFLIENVEVTFNEDNEYILNDGRITDKCIVNAYFDAISVESALNHAIYVESFDGYIRFSTTTKFDDTLICTIEVRRY
ncbi:MAG: hypothetical protein J6B68_01905 [Lachnospiraceae bacterium]|nr:hypothetical protein [Lachnospiraceae bacterium]MBP3477602.1 hypothetical protein [Lachnospiraceae bacterium]